MPSKRDDGQAPSGRQTGLTAHPIAGDAQNTTNTTKSPDPPNIPDENAIAMYRKGVEIWEQTLNRLAQDGDDGCFWDNLETRPYLRARAGLADCLWDAGQREEAVGHYRDLLRLQPDDNQGIRYRLLPRLFLLNRDEEAAALLEIFPQDDSACWLYAKALLDFRRHGDSPASRLSLEAAFRKHPQPVGYILGAKTLPNPVMEGCKTGDDCAANPAAEEFLAVWRANPDAADWLKEMVGNRTGDEIEPDPTRINPV